MVFDHSLLLLHHLQLPVQCDIITDTPTQTTRSEPDGDETGDLDQCRAQLATLQAEHGQCVSSLEGSQKELASLRKGRQQLEQEVATLRQEHQRALREQDAQHQNAYTLLRDKMNEQLVGERRGRKNAEEEWGERVRSVRETLELEVNSLKYQLSSQLMTLEQSKEVRRRLCVCVCECVDVFWCVFSCVCVCMCICGCVCCVLNSEVTST